MRRTCSTQMGCTGEGKHLDLNMNVNDAERGTMDGKQGNRN